MITIIAIFISDCHFLNASHLLIPFLFESSSSFYGNLSYRIMYHIPRVSLVIPYELYYVPSYSFLLHSSL